MAEKKKPTSPGYLGHEMKERGLSLQRINVLYFKYEAVKQAR